MVSAMSCTRNGGPPLSPFFGGPELHLKNEKLNLSMEEAVMRLITKVEGVPWITEVRPISLLQMNYKIMTGIMGRRLVKVLPRILKYGQICSVDRKIIAEGMANVISALNYVEQKDLECALISLDQWKAFDQVYILS